MTLPGANILNENNDYTVYTVNSNQNGQYSLILPKDTEGEISMLVDINMKNDFDALVANTITKESLLEKLDKEYSKVKETNPHGIVVFPMMDAESLTNAVNSNDKQKIFDETKKIGRITSELYENLTEAGLDKSRINQKIMILEKNATDTKFVDWLKTQMPNFVDGIKMEQEQTNAVESPAIESAPEPVPEAPTAEENPVIPTDIFSEPIAETPAAEEISTPEPMPAPEAPVMPEPVAETPAVEETPTPEPMPAPEAPVMPEPVAETPAVEETPAPEPMPAPEAPVMPEPVAETPAAEETPVVEPQPINSVSIENTQAIPPVENNIPQPEPAQQAPQTVSIDKKSGGFANILIILVILALVTFGSIELGKFLFHTFGA